MERTARYWGGSAAMIAGILWALQGVIWTLGPKVQAEADPLQITNRPLFALFWLSIVGALLGSGVTAMSLQGRRDGRSRGLTRAGSITAGVVVALAMVAAAAVALAALGVAEAALVGVMSLSLNVAGVVLVISLTLIGLDSLRTRILPGPQRFLPLALAGLTLLTLLAILASGSQATVGLVAAVGIVTVSGLTWLLLGFALWPRSGPVGGVSANERRGASAR